MFYNIKDDSTTFSERINLSILEKLIDLVVSDEFSCYHVTLSKTFINSLKDENRWFLSKDMYNTIKNFYGDFMSHDIFLYIDNNSLGSRKEITAISIFH